MDYNCTLMIVSKLPRFNLTIISTKRSNLVQEEVVCADRKERSRLLDVEPLVTAEDQVAVAVGI